MFSFINFIGYYAGQNPSPTIQKSCLSYILSTLELIKTIRCLKVSEWVHLYKTAVIILQETVSESRTYY